MWGHPPKGLNEVLSVRKQTVQLGLLIITALFVIGCGIKSQQSAIFPNKPVNIVVPYTAGGFADTVVRILEKPLAKQMNQSVVVNKPGGSGSLAMLEVAKAKPDGHTLVLATVGTVCVTPNLAEVGYTYADFQSVAQVAATCAALAVLPDSQINTVAELLEVAKKKPNEIRIGTPGATSSYHIALQQLAKEQGVKLKLIPFGGTAETIAALLGKHLDAVIASLPALSPQVQADTFKLLGIADEERSSLFPQVATCKEQGLNFVAKTWYGLLAPQGTPLGVIQHLNQAVQQSITEPAVIEAFQKYNESVAYLGPREFDKKLQQEYQYYPL